MNFNNFCSIESQPIERNECYNRKLLEKKELPKIKELLKDENSWSLSSINLTNNFFTSNALINNNLSIETQNNNIQYSGTLSPLDTSITISPININNSNTIITNQYINHSNTIFDHSNMSNDYTSVFYLSNTEHTIFETTDLDTILSEFNNTEIVPGNNLEYINEIYNTFNIQNNT